MAFRIYPVMNMTTAYMRVADMSKRYRVCQGGMRAGKTYAILQYLIAYAEQRENKTISVISSTLPALRIGAIKDFKHILQETGHEQYFAVNKSTLTWTCRTGSIIEFIGLDGADGEMKARGASRDVLFINEANRITYATAKQIMMRTAGFIFLDFNPSSRFWVHDEIVPREDADFEIFTYLDNQEIPPAIKADLESQPKDTNWWRVYGEGLIGELEGNVFHGWEFLPKVPQSEVLCYGLDFGFKPDPCAMVAIRRDDNGMIIEQMFEETELTSQDIIDLVTKNVDLDIPIICDNARPEIIADMRKAGLLAVPCIKQEVIELNGRAEKVGRLGQIEKMSEVKFRAVGADLEREYLTYQYHETRDGKREPVIKDGNDHLIDAARYAWYWKFRHDTISEAINERVKEYA